MVARLQKWFKRLRSSVERHDVYVVLIIIVTALASFGLGRLSEEPEQVTAVEITNAFETTDAPQRTRAEEESEITPVPVVEGTLVGSKNSDKYHFPWCPGAQRIKEENKVWFTNRDEAEQAGYVPAANCKGL